MEKNMAHKYLNRDIEEKLMNMVQQNPILYDISNESYKNNALRQAIWKNIEQELGIPSKVLQTKWKNIRYGYSQLKKNGIQPSGSTRKRKYDLSFLDKFLIESEKVQRSMENIKIEQEELENSAIGNTSEEERLVNIVQLNPILYDVSNECYKNNAVRQNIWKNIELELGIPRKMLQIKWKNIRYAYSQSKKNNNQTRGTGRKRKLDSYDLSFLDKFLFESEETSSSFENIDIEQDEIENPAIDYSLEVEEEVVSNYDPLATPFNHVCDDKPDSEELYCLSLADPLRCMERSERERVKFEIARIFKDAVYKK